ncbi:MAG: hypothetical protein ABJ311_08150, partial [Erythrobacter sp.]
ASSGFEHLRSGSRPLARLRLATIPSLMSTHQGTGSQLAAWSRSTGRRPAGGRSPLRRLGRRISARQMAGTKVLGATRIDRECCEPKASQRATARRRLCGVAKRAGWPAPGV